MIKKLKKDFRQIVEAFKTLLGLNGRRGSSSMWRSQRLAQSPNGPRPRPGDQLGHYAGPGGTTKRHKYTPEEVKRILRGLEKGNRAHSVMAQAATFSSLIDERMVRYFRGRERLFDRLTYVMQQYISGRPCQEIAEKVSFFSDGQDVEEAIDFAARLIANHLNRQLR